METATHAIKAGKLLSRAGIPSRAVKVTANEKQGGCRHGVEIDERSLFDAASVLRNGGIVYSVYSGGGNDIL